MKVKTLFLILFVSLCLLLTSCSKDSKEIYVINYGAAENVSGSMFYLHCYNKNYLVDCGQFYNDVVDNVTYEERKKAAVKENDDFPFNVESIDAVILTHAHLDHIGRVSLLVNKGYKNKIYCTRGTALLLEVILKEQIRYSDAVRNWTFSRKSIKTGKEGNEYVIGHFTDCWWSRKISNENRYSSKNRRTELEDRDNISISPCKDCAESELREIMLLIKEVDFNQAIELDKGVTFNLSETGHLPGSSSVLINVNNDNTQKKLLFSGDLGNSMSIFQEGPHPPISADYVWVENTYGGIIRDSNIKNEYSTFIEDIKTVLEGGGIVWIPAFALDRTQKVLALLKQAQSQGTISDNIKIFLTSPTAEKFNDLYENGLLNKDKFKYGNTFPKVIDKYPDSLNKPHILITTSGMMDMAASKTLLKRLLPNKKVHIFIVGYQDPDSPGGQLKQGNTKLFLDDKEIVSNATIHNYKVFSSHPDAKEISYWLSNQNKTTAKIILIHGGKQQLASQKEFLANLGYTNIIIPKRNDKIMIDHLN
ncbi:MAG: MBL fold metallo-hydrolase [Ignavibacteria bacterium]